MPGKMVDKVRKLLAKAKGTNNENEAATFAAKARAIMDEYGIEEHELREEVEPEGVVFDTMVMTVIDLARRSLATATAELYMCKAFYYEGRLRMIFVGRESRTVVAKMMYKYFLDTIDRIVKEVDGNESYRVGCTMCLAWRLIQMSRAPVKGETLPAVIEEARAEAAAAMEKLGTQVVPVGTSFDDIDIQSFLEGAEAAEGIGLDVQVGSSSNAAIGNG